MREGVTEVIQVLQMELPQAVTATVQEARPPPPPPPMMRAVRLLVPVQMQLQPQPQVVQNQGYFEKEVPFEEM